MHWASTPEGKLKLSKAIKKGWRKKRLAMKMEARAEKVKKQIKHSPKEEIANGSSSQEIPSDTFAYALGHIECWIETFCKSANLPTETFTAQLGKVLSSKSKR